MASSEPVFSATRALQWSAKAAADTSTVSPPVATRRRAMTSWQTVQWTYHWLLWLFLVGLVAAQLSCAFWDSSTRHEATVIGQPPANGPHDLAIEQVDSEPYADRIFVCALNGGRHYEPMQVSSALARPQGTQLVQPSSTLPNDGGYRIVRRAITPVFPSETWNHLSATCDLVAWTLDAILDSCTALGYNVTRDYARVVDGLDDTAKVAGIADALPILIELIADDGLISRYIVPTQAGSACVVRLLGRYEAPKSTSALILRGVERAVYEQTTQWFLGSDNRTAGGSWRYGWFEKDDGSKWHSEVISTSSSPASDAYGVLSRVFDTEHNVERSMATQTAWSLESSWGPIASASDTVLWYQSLSISNGSQFGIFRFESSQLHVVRSKFTLETLLVNLSTSWVLLRWAACMVALQRSYKNGSTVVWQAASIGNSVSSMRGFHLLPFFLLVRSKTILAAIWTTGCWFNDDQRAASEAWFIIYPSIAQMVFLQFSVLNIVAKMMRRRVSDAMFGPTLAVFCLLHLVRCFVFSEALTSFVSSAEITNLSLPEMLSPNVVFRLNGKIAWLVYVKLVVLITNWLPLVCFYKTNVIIRKRSVAVGACHVERALALRVANLGGFGSSCVFVDNPDTACKSTTGIVVSGESSTPPPPAIMPSELLRMGYLLLGGRYVLSFNDYFLLVLLTPWRRRDFPPNFRVMVFVAKLPSVAGHAALIAPEPELFRLNDPRLLSVDLFDVATAPMH